MGPNGPKGTAQKLAALLLGLVICLALVLLLLFALQGRMDFS